MRPWFDAFASARTIGRQPDTTARRRGVTGTYTYGGDDAPGGFLCYSANGGTDGFTCWAEFECSGMADDFRCYDSGARVFTCGGAFGTCGQPAQGNYGACSPSTNRTFRCNQGTGQFACTGTFECPARFANS